MAAPITIPANISISTTSLNRSTRQVQQALGRITGQASEFQKSLDASTARVFAFGATTAVLQAVNQSFKKLISTTVEVEKKLIEINSIFQATNAQFSKFRDSIFQVAKDTGQSFNTVAEGAAELARQGLSAEETAKRLKAALILTRISGMDAEKSVKSLTAAMNGFTSAGLSAEQIVNKIVAVDTAFAVSAQDLADGFSRAGSTAEDAGVSFDQLLGLITAVEQRTARGGAVIGNAFKSIFTRLSRGTTIDELKELGVEIDSSQTGIQKLKALSAALENISDPTVASKIKELAGGVFQINVVSSTLKDLSSETSIFASAAKEAASATNEAFQKNELLNTSLAAQINSLVAGITNLAEKIGGITIAPLLGNLVKIATVLSDSLDGALDPEKGNAFIKGLLSTISAFISGPGLIMVTVAFLKITKLVAKFAMDGFKSVMAIGSAQEKNKQIEAGIVRLLQHDVQLRKQLANQSLSQAQKEQAVLDAIKRENALLRDQERLMRNITSLARQRGVTGHSSSKGFKGKGFSAGHMQEEANARMLGATSSVRAHRGQGTIGGKSFIMNNQETEIPNFGRNGDSAVIPHYAKGFVPNFAKKVRQPSLPADIAGANRSRFFKGESDEYQSVLLRDWVKKNSKDPRAIAILAKKNEGKQKLGFFANAKVGDGGFIMLTPELGGYNEDGANRRLDVPRKKDKHKLHFFDGASAGINKDIKDSDDPDAKKFSALVNLDEELKEGLSSGLSKTIKNILKTIHPELKLKKSISPKKIVNQLEEGGAGAFGALRGAAFEKIMNIAVGNLSDGGSKLDINFDQDEGNYLDMIFDLPKGQFKRGDFKVSSKSDNKSKYINQVLKSKYKGKIATRDGRTPIPRGKGRAGGFVPNYSQTDRGVPMSKIRAHFDGAGNPVAVTNTMDEPNGLSDVRNNGLADAISRERQGIGMHSEGFVPNFAIGFGMAAKAIIGRGGSLLGGAKNKAKKALSSSKATKANIKSLKENTKKLKKENAEIQERIRAGNLSKKQLKKYEKKLKKNNSTISDNAGQLQQGSGTGIMGMFGLSSVSGGFQSLGDNRREAGDKTGASVADLGSTVAEFASMGMMFGPKGAAVGAAVGGIAHSIGIGLNAHKTKKETEERVGKDEDMRKRLARGMEFAGGGKKIGSTIESLSESGKSANDFSKKLAEQRDKLISLARDGDSKKFGKEVEKLAKMMKIAQTQVASFKELDRLVIESKALSETLKKQRVILNKASEARVESAKDAVDKLGFASKIRTPELTGERKNLVERSLRGQSAIAGAQLNRQELGKLEKKLSQETDEDKRKEIGEKIKQAETVFKNSVVSASTTLKNNLKEAEFDLGKLKKTLTTQQEKTFDSRLELAGNLKGETVTADVVRDNVKRLREAGDDPEKLLLAVQRLNDNKTQLDALSPAIFKGILDAMGMSGKEQEELTRKSDELSLRGAGITDQKTIDAIIERLKKDRPDIKHTQDEIDVLKTSIKDTREQIDIFKEAFNPASIKTNVGQISTALENFAKGMGDGTSILAQINKVNLNAAMEIARSTTVVEKAAKAIDKAEKRIDVVDVRVTTLEGKLKP